MTSQPASGLRRQILQYLTARPRATTIEMCQVLGADTPAMDELDIMADEGILEPCNVGGYLGWEIIRTAARSGGPVLSAVALTALIRAAGVPCVTLVPDEAAAAAIPGTRAGEGLRVVDGTMPVRLAYPIPPAGADGHYPALRRRDSHVLWLYDWAEQHRWSVRRDADDEWITIAPEPRPATYVLDGRECFRATGRPADENLGSWAVLMIVDDPGAWAAAIEAEVAADIAGAGKLRASREYLGRQRLDGARRIREDGPGQWIYSVERGPFPGRAIAKTLGSLDQSHPAPGVRYVPAPVTATAACVTCFCPMIEAGGQWHHHTGGYPAGCPGRSEGRDLPLEPGDWEIDTGAGTMVCGYCGESASWPETVRDAARLTGIHSLGTGPDGELVVLAEVTRRDGTPAGWLPHLCQQIPPALYKEHAAAITERILRTERIT